ncbi:MAG: universal stress protein [Peptococcaceae bacterium]|jgi:nucleotide-binding universal stress UspA family protein|nr:universal stress protein [Peptococcaceae bacterium]
MLQRILVGYDDEARSKKALEAAIEIARSNQAEIFIVSSLDIPLYVSSPDVFPVDNISISKYFSDNTRRHFEELHQQASAKVKAAGLKVTTKVLDGNPGKALIRYAEEIKADLIAVGSNNKGVLNRFFLGSVSNFVVNHARCMVLVVKG